MMPPDAISLDFISRQYAQLLEEVKAARAENRELRRTFTLISEYFSRQERRFTELRDDVETMIKIEVGGAIANLETRLGNEFEARIGKLEHRLSSVEERQEKLQLGQDLLQRGLENLQREVSNLTRGQAQFDSKLDAILAAVSRA